MQHSITPQETGEFLMRNPQLLANITTTTTLTVVTCSDPRVASVTKNINARLIRLPGVVVDPSWSGFSFLREESGHTLVLLGHSQCLAHQGSYGEAVRQVQWIRGAIWHRYQNNHACAVGMIDVGSLDTIFLDPFGGVADIAEAVPAQYRSSTEELRAISGQHVDPHSTTYLHPPVAVMAISLGGALTGVRERDLLYVIDSVGQPEPILKDQIRMIGNIVLSNAHAIGVFPHLLIAVNDALTAAEMHIVKKSVMETLGALDGGSYFTSEIIVLDRAHGQFAVVNSSVGQTESSWRHSNP